MAVKVACHIPVIGSSDESSEIGNKEADWPFQDWGTRVP
jgi:hypothetical protein